ncbi:YlaF family protein [Bacillus sp. FJAT-22090]|uniref:YlaF family protein n=1 Tax=Bacillus sp. FJAT-22090 TaxID=1581038 RepID=UPI0011A8D871|nr:YlaF family protein [Bacillus sp. FJAT-22090]
MGNIKWIFVLYSFGAILSMALIGVAIALRNIPLIFLFLVLLFVVMGFGFKTKKKMRDQGLL